jgi:hypothetical protein
MAPRQPLQGPRGISPRLAEDLARAVYALVDAAVQDRLAARAAGGDVDPELPHWQWWMCPSRRAAIALARTGAVQGVRRVGRGRSTAYLARRSALEAYVESEYGRAAELPVDDAFELAMRRRGLITGAAPAHGKQGGVRLLSRRRAGQ